MYPPACLGLDCRQKSCGDEQEGGDQSNTFDHQAMLADGGRAGKDRAKAEGFLNEASAFLFASKRKRVGKRGKNGRFFGF